MEYDTFLDPPDPLTASAQVLFGVIMSFITGLVDTPGEIYRGLSSAARGIRQPHEHFDRHSACRAALSSPDHSSPESGLESDESPIQNAVGQMLTENNEQGDREIREENSTQEDTTDEENDNQVNELDRIRSTGRKRNLQLEKAKTMSSSMTPSKPPKFTILHEAALHGGQMSKKIVKIVILLPTDVSLGMARGFHNAPKLYSDLTVTDIPQVVSLRTGFRAAGKVVTANQRQFRTDILTSTQELKDGFYFGITGLITHPRYGLKHEGAKGLFKGVGKAMGGLFLKPTAGTWKMQAM